MLTEVTNGLSQLTNGYKDSLLSLKDFLSGVKNRFEDAETKVKARLNGWLDKFKPKSNSTTTDDPKGLITSYSTPINPIESIEEKRDELDRLNNELDELNKPKRLEPYDESSQDLFPKSKSIQELQTEWVKNYFAKSKTEHKIEAIQESMTPEEKKLYEVHQNIEKGKQNFEQRVDDFKSKVDNATNKVNSFFDKLKNR